MAKKKGNGAGKCIYCLKTISRNQKFILAIAGLYHLRCFKIERIGVDYNG